MTSTTIAFPLDLARRVLDTVCLRLDLNSSDSSFIRSGRNGKPASKTDEG